MGRSFSEREKQHIRNRLFQACRNSWTQYGYKKTSVDELCKQVGISKGAFYIFFESKESLFAEVLCSVQNEICTAASEIMKQYHNKQGVVKALELVYREYDRNNFLYCSDSTDFMIMMSKLSEEQTEKILISTQRSRNLFAAPPGLQFQVDEELGISVIYSLIMNIKNKDILPFNHLDTFDFMAAQLVNILYKEVENP